MSGRTLSAARRHHYVTRAYIERFAEKGAVFVRRRDGRTFTTSPLNVAVEIGLYDLPDDTPGVTPWAEQSLGSFDDAAITAIRSIDRTGEPPLAESAERSALANFLALQVGRTPEQRERVLFPDRVRTFAAGRPLTQELVAEYLEIVHLRFAARAPEIQAAYDFVTFALDEAGAGEELFVRQMFDNRATVAARLLGMQWTLELDRKETLITSDTPLVIWRTPTPRDRFEGIGVGSAAELRFPLDPDKQLVLSKRRRTTVVRIPAARARACNADTVAACYEMVIAPPRRRHVVDAIGLAAHRPALRFNTAPGYEVGPDGKRHRMEGEVLHMWVPRR